jgi:pimeloyl-ACP methyl ester carboxylesterase
LAAITAPTLAIQGAADEHATPQHLTDLGAAVAGAQTWLVPAAGHMLPQDAPEVFNPRLLDFLAQHRPGGTHV